MTHTAICKQNDGSGWITLAQQDGQWTVTATSRASLEHVMTGMIADMRKTKATSDLTFTTRRLADIVIAELPDDLHALVGVSVSILAPEGAPAQETLWNSAWLDPTGSISAPGPTPASRFRVQTIPDAIERWFQRENFRSFEAPRTAERFTLGNQIHRPPHHRELLIRQSWRIRDLVPTAFPSVELLAQREAQHAAAKATYDERRRLKNPRERRLARQAEWTKERAAKALDPVAAERARKAKHGLDWSGTEA